MRKLLVVLFSSVFCVASAQTTKRSITETDLFRFQWIGDPQISPDSARIVFPKVVVNRMHDGYESSLYTVPVAGGELQRLTSGKSDSDPRWSPDGQWIAFSRAPEKDGKPQPGQIFLLSMAGGEPVQLTNLITGANTPVWSPDGKQIAFLSDTSPEDTEKAERRDVKNCAPEDDPNQNSNAADPAKAPCPDEHASDVRTITRAVYRLNGQGYLDPKHPTHLWVIDVPKGTEDQPKPRQLTKGKYEESEIFWAKDGSKIYYTTILLEEPQYELCLLYTSPSPRD